MKLLPNKKIIKDQRKTRNEVFSKINRRKAFWKKWKFLFFIGPNTLLKRQYVLSKKKRFFVQKNLARKFFILKKQLRLFCLYSPYNLLFVVRSPSEYLKMKTDLIFSNLGLLNFKFWHLKKKWIFEIFKEQKENLKHLPILNGAVLVLKVDGLATLMETLCLFEHKNSVCVGVFIFGRMVWPSYFLNNVLNLEETWSAVCQKVKNKMKNILYCFRVLFSVFNKVLKKECQR